jgi:hypothetical protein
VGRGGGQRGEDVLEGGFESLFWLSALDWLRVVECEVFWRGMGVVAVMVFDGGVRCVMVRRGVWIRGEGLGFGCFSFCDFVVWFYVCSRVDFWNRFGRMDSAVSRCCGLECLLRGCGVVCRN